MGIFGSKLGSSAFSASSAAGEVTQGIDGTGLTVIVTGIGIIPRSQNSFYGNASNPYQEPKPDLFRGISQASNVFQEMISADSGAFGQPYGRPGLGDHRELYDGQPVLADHVSQQLLRDHVKLKPSLDLNPSSSMLGRNSGI